jgi:hypothetical protein
VRKGRSGFAPAKTRIVRTRQQSFPRRDRQARAAGATRVGELKPRGISEACRATMPEIPALNV